MSCDSLRRLLDEFLEDFYVKVDTDPEVDLPVALEKLDFSTSPLYLALRSTCRLHLESWMFFYEPLVSCPGCVSVEAFKTNFTHFLRDGELES